MSNQQAEMDAALDKILGSESDEGQEVQDERIIEEVVNNPVDNEQEQVIDDQDPAEDKQEEEKPPGFMDYKAWTEAGKDPKKYRGEDAYNAEYDRIQEIKSLKSDFGEMKNTLGHVAEGMEDWRQQQTNTIRAQVEQELATAKEAGNIDDALDAQDKLNQINQPKTAQPQQQQENPVIQEFRRKNPMTERGNSRFNADYTADLESFYNKTVKDLGGKLTDDQVTRVLNSATKQAKSLHPDLFESPRNNRQTTTRPAKKSAAPRATDYRNRLKGVGNARNTNDSNAAVDIYDMLLNKKGGGKEAAERFAKTTLGE